MNNLGKCPCDDGGGGTGDLPDPLVAKTLCVGDPAPAVPNYCFPTERATQQQSILIDPLADGNLAWGLDSSATFDQSLNTTDDVKFNSVETARVFTPAAAMDIDSAGTMNINSGSSMNITSTNFAPVDIDSAGTMNINSASSMNITSAGSAPMTIESSLSVEMRAASGMTLQSTNSNVLVQSQGGDVFLQAGPQVIDNVRVNGGNNSFRLPNTRAPAGSHVLSDVTGNGNLTWEPSPSLPILTTSYGSCHVNNSLTPTAMTQIVWTKPIGPWMTGTALNEFTHSNGVLTYGGADSKVFQVNVSMGWQFDDTLTNTDRAEFFWNSNTLSTTFTSIGTFVPVVGPYLQGSTQNFTLVGNTLTYNGAGGTFYINSNFGVSKVIAGPQLTEWAVVVDGVTVLSSYQVMNVASAVANEPETASCSCSIALNTGQTVQLAVRALSNLEGFEVTTMNFNIIEQPFPIEGALSLHLNGLYLNETTTGAAIDSAGSTFSLTHILELDPGDEVEVRMLNTVDDRDFIARFVQFDIAQIGGGLGNGGVTGPISSTPNALALWNGSSATQLKDSNATLSSFGVLKVDGPDAMVELDNNASIIRFGNFFNEFQVYRDDGVTPEVVMDGLGGNVNLYRPTVVENSLTVNPTGVNQFTLPLTAPPQLNYVMSGAGGGATAWTDIDEIPRKYAVAGMLTNGTPTTFVGQGEVAVSGTILLGSNNGSWSVIGTALRYDSTNPALMRVKIECHGTWATTTGSSQRRRITVSVNGGTLFSSTIQQDLGTDQQSFSTSAITFLTTNDVIQARINAVIGIESVLVSDMHYIVTPI